MTRLIAACAALLLLGSSHAALGQEQLTYPELVRRMIDLEHLAAPPRPGETCKQWSSWDRRSQYDAEKDEYVNWGANGDGNGIIRREGDLEVMAEMDGPGCIWRVWSARAQDGHVKIYLDGQETPAVDLPFKDYFTGRTAPFNYPMLSYDLGELGCKGQNLYYPIPYQKSCKIVAEKGWGRYYQFVYTTFPRNTRVPTFSRQIAAENAATLEQVDTFLRDKLGTDPAGPREDEETIRNTVRIAPGKAERLEIARARAITAIRAKMDFKDRDDQMAALRQLVLKITFDEARKPQVWCPAGDFFGTAPGYNPYKTLVTGMTDEGAYAYWYMPFKNSAVLELLNEGDEPREVEYEIVHAPLPKGLDLFNHFHCWWHRDAAEVPEDRWPDWLLLDVAGTGRFCGVMLHVWNPQGGWWGEGDEKFFVDGEKYPSTFGTGSEDYFGYAWCHPGLFQRPFHAQTMTSGNRGHQSVLRWHVADSVPFHKSFEACIEKYYRTEEKGTQYAATVCWYAGKRTGHAFEPAPIADRHDYYEKTPPTAAGFKILGTPPGNVQTQGMGHFKAGTWKDNNHLWWTGAKPGDTLELAVPVKKAGKYDVSVVLTKARDYAVVQLALDGRKAGPEIDLYHPEVTNTEPISLGSFDLAEGEHTLSVRIVGANEKAVKSYMFGIDQLALEPAR